MRSDRQGGGRRIERRLAGPPIAGAAAVSLAAALAACGGGGSAGGDGGGAGGPDAAVPPPPAALCEAPVGLADTSQPDQIVGDGTPAGCTEAALAAALAAGGVITFDCGAEPHTIPVTAPLAVTAALDTVIDGGGLVALDGGGMTRILELDAGFDTASPTLTVQRLTFTGGTSQPGGEDTAVGGGAIYRDGGSLVVIDSIFTGNRAPATGQDVAGGAIYGFGGGATVIVGSVFSGNQASNGGAVAGLQTDLTVVNSTLADNAATGSGGNPGDGGTGGAIYQDGTDELTAICGSALRDNRAGAIGGALFRVSNTEDGRFAMDRTTVSGNAVAEAETSLAGGMYLQGLAIEITASAVASNRAGFGGGIWLGQGSTVAMTNVTVADNEAFTSHGGGIWLAGSPSGLILNCTIAGNRSTSDDGFAAALFGPAPALTLRNTVIADQRAGNPFPPISCDNVHPDGGGNLQWPVERESGGSDDPDQLCAAGALVADADLGPLGDHGGPTPTLVPAAGSPAIGAGQDCPATDQRGLPRGEPCTSGAVEAE